MSRSQPLWQAKEYEFKDYMRIYSWILRSDAEAGRFVPKVRCFFFGGVSGRATLPGCFANACTVQEAATATPSCTEARGPVSLNAVPG